MDLDKRGRRDLSALLVGRYALLAGDPELATLQPMYRCHFALVRAKVSAIRARDTSLPDAERQQARREAAAYTHLAAAYTLRPTLIITTGLPGSGKSWAAAQVAAPLGAVVLRSDEVRKELAGLSPTARTTGKDRDRLYSQAMTDRTYSQLLSRAASALTAGYHTILDGTYPSDDRRRSAVALAESRGAPWAIIHTTAPAETIRKRMTARSTDQSEVSDADFQIYLQSRGSFAAPAQFPPERVIESGPHIAPEVTISRVLETLTR
jgi:uncharacterized protein